MGGLIEEENVFCPTSGRGNSKTKADPFVLFVTALVIEIGNVAGDLWPFQASLNSS